MTITTASPIPTGIDPLYTIEKLIQDKYALLRGLNNIMTYVQMQGTASKETIMEMIRSTLKEIK